ncbi:alpha/beta fold hydrolase [Dietzia sp. UCD-THP]|uniref:alpha/beta fold hydrolase n=1 Tax=Dietzia sp. UCD-THP TaxID=1292020 RepID=UPI0003651127|nr:alpha/beta hydrolase [Dietzia sp. UCD-THP]
MGAAEFGAANPHQNTRFARAMSTFGQMERAVRDSDVGAVTAFRQSPDTSRQVVGPATHSSTGSFPTFLLPLTTVGFSCSTLDAQSRCENGNPTGVAAATAGAVSETRSLDVRTASILGADLVSYSGRNPIRATAACSPTAGAATLSSDGPVILGRNGLFEQEVRVAMPGPNSEQTGYRSWGSYDYVATLQHVRKEGPGYALSQLRLRVNATGTGGAERWNLTLILAHAECGVDRAATAAPTRPTPGKWPVLSAQSNRMMAVQADAPTALQSEDADPEGVEPSSDKSSVPSSPSTDDAPAVDSEPGATGDKSESGATTTTAPATTTPVAQSEPAEQSTGADAQQRPENVAPGRWFTVMGRSGVELASARIYDIVRSPGCGVALILSITTSAEDDDFVVAVLGAGLGENVSDAERDFWIQTYRINYRRDEGRRRLRTSSINLRDRDGPEARLSDVHCPVLWLQGTADQVYSVANAEDGIARFTGSLSATLQIVEGGQHFLTASDPEVADAATLAFVEQWS